MYKNFLITTTIILLALTTTSSVFAATNNNDTQEVRRDLRKEIRENRRDARRDLKDARQDNNKNASNSAAKNNRANISNATLAAVNGTTLTVTKDSKTYTVTVSSDTKIRRHFGGAASLAELAVGNKLDVRGTFTDDAKISIAAKHIRDRSIMKFRGAFIGDVVSKTGTTIVLRSKHRGDQTVTVSTSTKYVNRKQDGITLNDIVVGHRVRVKGVWDKSNNTVTQVTQVKDFSLPPKASDSANQNSSASATVTP